jgi:hypothetical protein
MCTVGVAVAVGESVGAAVVGDSVGGSEGPHGRSQTFSASASFDSPQCGQS